MNLSKLFEAQKVLRNRIGYNESDRFNKLILALLVELGECANEWRGFKFWSKDQQPRTSKARAPYMDLDDADFYNPLLEEYVDGFHFVLEIGLEFGFDYITPFIVHIEKTEEMFLKIAKNALLLKQSGRYYKEFYFGELLSAYLGLGRSLGFKWEEIEQAYFAKNAINHQRQESGY